MTYDYDVAVIGAGPAGMAAALRVRWLKRHHCVPCSVVIFDPAGYGGLMQLGATFLTGPSWSHSSSKAIESFTRDIERFQIPLEKEEVIAIERIDGGVLRVSTRKGREYTCLAVVVASGMKLLVNEAAFFGHGLETTCMSYRHIARRLREIFSQPENFPLALVGSGKLTNLISLTEELRSPGQSVWYVIEEPAGPLVDEASGRAPGSVISGRVERYLGNGSLSGLLVGDRMLHCSRAVVDFNSYELRPQPLFPISPEPKRDAQGFFEVDRRMRTSVEGIFAAGDITGVPACVSKSIGEGVVAGFSTYEYVHRLKFKSAPPLFAYIPEDRYLNVDEVDLPENIFEYLPVPLTSADSLAAEMRLEISDRVDDAVAALLDRDRSALLAACGSQDSFRRVVLRLVQAKLITLHLI